MNNKNNLNIKRGKYLKVLKEDNINIAKLSLKEEANARVLEIFKDGSFTAHLISNYNLRGDFRTELMYFNNKLILDEEDKKTRNEIRASFGLIEIE